MAHDFRYVTKKEAAPIKAEIMDIIHEVQDIVRQYFTFRYDFIGSSKRNMITYDTKGNTGFDFDVNIAPNDDDENFSAAEIKHILMDAFGRACRKYGYDYPENSTRVFTIKVKDRCHSRIIHSCDFAIVYNCSDGRQQYIRFNKKSGTYSWEYQGKDYVNLNKRINWLKNHDLWGDLLEYYIFKKNNNSDYNKHSRNILTESVKEMCQKNGYFR